MLAHPALPDERVVLAGERYGVTLGWPVGVHRVTGTLLLPPTVTAPPVILLLFYRNGLNIPVLIGGLTGLLVSELARSARRGPRHQPNRPEM